ncbi:hypothetical protein H696_03015 [Fonticula alba]|uniref:Uncharacterized protein n=1 Tax=Fonticula alba TaxID=691883 RepID=A0A058Z8R8_FONAL|nr:hypothetical protein H696_03015 [Fonticula alba]KCV70660.1 hypothetical protein H696_03015 [Fonticula alba]|eukprot:XP_009495176.1 hypothetical protein H696_03015 [Fonticula alba]
MTLPHPSALTAIGICQDELARTQVELEQLRARIRVANLIHQVAATLAVKDDCTACTIGDLRPCCCFENIHPAVPFLQELIRLQQVLEAVPLTEQDIESIRKHIVAQTPLERETE